MSSTTTTTTTTIETKSSEARWLSVDQYLELIKKSPVCGYIPPRGQNRGKVCCSHVVTNINPVDLPKLRCKSCAKKGDSGCMQVEDILFFKSLRSI